MKTVIEICLQKGWIHLKEWLIEHKLYIVILFIIAAAGFYYFYISGSGQEAISSPVPNKSGSSTQVNPKNTEGQKPMSGASSGQQAKLPEKIMVDIKGEVKQPGVYESKAGERVMDIVTRAGGLTDHADKSQINLAQHVQDEMMIYIPAKGETVHSTVGTGGNAGNAAREGAAGKNTAKIDLNKADEQALETLPGIGPAKAAVILEYREKNGPFKTIEDLKNISGFGDKTFEKLKDMISAQ